MPNASVSEGVTFAIAIAGLVLGVFNTWQNFNRDRVKLRVSMKIAYPIPEDADRGNQEHLAIRVISESPFPLTIAQLGVRRRRGPPLDIRLTKPLMLDGVALPPRMEPRSSFTAYIPLGETTSFLRDIARVYAQTDAGRTVFSPRRESARVARQIVRELSGIDESAHGD